ncbi:MAG: FHA domain-containing serine/threonine-protein kinase [Planctomycetota bacterium]
MPEKTVELDSTNHGQSIHVEVRSGPHSGEFWSVQLRGPITIGRQSPSHIRLPKEPGASTVHCQIEPDGQQLRIRDLGSTNGTLLNGMSVRSGIFRSGETILVGQSEIVITSQPSDEDLSPRTDVPVESRRRHRDQVEGEQDSLFSEAEDEGTRVAVAGPSIPEEVDSGQTPHLSRQQDPSPATGEAATGEAGTAETVAQGTQKKQSDSTFDSIEPFSIPRDFANYRLVERIGQGGMATVYRAVHRRSGEVVAIKMIRSIGQPSQKQLSLFLREGTLITKLRHPRIVHAHEIGFHDEQPFLVMEYVSGIDLLALMGSLQGNARLRTATWVASRLLQALHYAHGQGIVHRDVKISNLLAFREAHRLQVKLADFGLAKIVVDSGISQITNERSMRGTLAYMAPEQIRESRSVGFTADLYSAGICLLRLLGGELPKPAFEPNGGNVAKVLASLQGVPKPLARVIEKATKPAINDRYQSAESMNQDLFPFHQRP